MPPSLRGAVSLTTQSRTELPLKVETPAWIASSLRSSQ